MVDEPWPGDLGRAHDLPVTHASGDWVLILDADEVLDPACAATLREHVETADRDGYAVTIRNYTYRVGDSKWRPADPLDPLARGAGGYVPTRPIRIFRRDDAYRHTGSLHQSVLPSILAAGGRVGDSDLVVHHYGFLRFDREKSQLYLRLARRELEARPGQPQPWVDLGIVLLEARRLAEAADAFRHARRLGDRVSASYLLGSALLDMGHADAAIAPLREAARGNHDDSSPHFDAADAWEALGLAYDQVGEREQAQAAYRRAVRTGRPSAIGNLAAFLLDGGELAQAQDLLERVLVDHRGIDTLWSLLGVLRLRQKDPAGAATALEVALDIRPENLAARVNLALAYGRSGRRAEAAKAYAAAAEAIGTEEARQLNLARRLPPPYRQPRPARLPRPGSRLVLSVIPALAGGGGRVMVDAILGLDDRPHLVVCLDAFDYSGQGLREELRAAGVETVTVPSAGALHSLLRRLDPSLVLHHWWRGSFVPGPVRATDAPWVCIGHAPLPMPAGYDAYVVNSRFHHRFQAHLPADRVVMIANGVDLDRFAPRKRTADGPVRIVMLSRLDPGKFPRRLLAHLPELSDAELLVAGFGARRHELRPEIAAHGLENSVRLLGPVRSADVPRLLETADIGLHLTETHEELCSMTLLEMLATGLPIVAEPKGGIPEMVADGGNGFLVRGEEQTAEALQRLIETPSLRSRMGHASRATARRYDMRTYRTSMRRLLADVEAGRPAAPWVPATVNTPAVPRASTGFVPSLSYLVCATPRSGSTLLCEALMNTGLAGIPTEFFMPALSRTLGGRWQTARFDDYVRELFERTSSPNGVFGAKVMWEHLSELLAGLQVTTAGSNLEPHALLEAHLPRLRYVHIRRRDRLRQAISWERALQTGCWNTLEYVPAAPAEEPRFDRAAIERRMEQLAALESSWEAFFREAGIDPIRVEYEELASDHEETAQRVLGQLGISVPPDLRVESRRLRRQSDESDEWLRMFREGATNVPDPAP